MTNCNTAWNSVGKWPAEGVKITHRCYATTVSSNDYLQVRPFLKWELLIRKEFAPIGSEFFAIRAIPKGVKDHFYHKR